MLMERRLWIAGVMHHPSFVLENGLLACGGVRLVGPTIHGKGRQIPTKIMKVDDGPGRTVNATGIAVDYGVNTNKKFPGLPSARLPRILLLRF